MGFGRPIRVGGRGIAEGAEGGEVAEFFYLSSRPRVGRGCWLVVSIGREDEPRYPRD